MALAQPHSPKELLEKPGLLVGFFVCLFFPPTFMFTASKGSKEVHFWLRPHCQFSTGSVSFPGT